jgi:hypothetical protein
MPKFMTLTPIKFSAEEITPENTEVELTDKQAKPLLAQGAIAPVAPKGTKAKEPGESAQQ